MFFPSLPAIVIIHSTQESTFWGQPAAWISLVALVVSVAAYMERKRATSSQHVQRFSEYYDSVEMYEALRTLRHWVDGLRGHDPQSSAETSMRALQAQSGGVVIGGPIEHANQPVYLDAMRRRVSSYFERLCQFREARYLRHKDFVMLITASGEQLMTEAVAPLQRAKIQVDLDQLDPADEAGRDRQARWLAKFERHLQLIQKPTRRTLWRQFRSR